MVQFVGDTASVEVDDKQRHHHPGRLPRLVTGRNLQGIRQVGWCDSVDVLICKQRVAFAIWDHTASPATRHK